jgi:hypothetical protein
MALSKAQWNITQVVEGKFSEYSYLALGDTFIKGFQYRKIFQVGSKGFQYIGALRDDTLLRKVFYLHGSIEDLLYDFNAQIGDTLKTYNSPFGRVIIDEIDSILIESDFRKVWGVKVPASPGSEFNIIEGIGSTSGLLNSIPHPIEVTSRLDCYSEEVETLYPHFNSSQACPFTTSTTKLNVLPIFNIKPNPANGYFEVLTSEKDFEIEIMNSLGETIDRFESRFFFDITFYPNGIYYLKFKSKRSIQTRKLLVN